MPRYSPVCALLSGGVESAALAARLLKLGRTVFPLYVRGGYRWEDAEERSLRRLLRALAAPGLRPLTCAQTSAREVLGRKHWALGGQGVPDRASADEAVYLPGRNLFLISAAAVFCAQNGIDTIVLGTLGGNPFPDAGRPFLSQLEGALAACFGRKLRIETPFRSMDKRRVILNAGALPWELTFSCLSPRRDSPCRRCNKCEERRKALGPSAPRPPRGPGRELPAGRGRGREAAPRPSRRA